MVSLLPSGQIIGSSTVPQSLMICKTKSRDIGPSELCWNFRPRSARRFFARTSQIWEWLRQATSVTRRTNLSLTIGRHYARQEKRQPYRLIWGLLSQKKKKAAG